jgi:hypothetical protein
LHMHMSVSMRSTCSASFFSSVACTTCEQKQQQQKQQKGVEAG